MKKTILFIAGLAAGIALHAQTQSQSDTTKVKTANTQQITSDEALNTRASYSSIKDLEYESWDSYYILASSDFYQRGQTNSTQQSTRKSSRIKNKTLAKKD